MTTTSSATINGVDTEALKQVMAEVSEEPAKGLVTFAVTSTWKGGTRSDAHVSGFELGGERVTRDFTIPVDEPEELLGTNVFPNPQEYLLAALNGCMIVGYAAAAAMEGVTLSKLQIEADGDIDLRGFLGLAPVRPGYEELRYTVRIAGDGTEEQMRAIHESVQNHSVNRDNLANPIKLVPELVVEER